MKLLKRIQNLWKLSSIDLEATPIETQKRLKSLFNKQATIVEMDNVLDKIQ